jgi:hypothetical protein
MVSDISVDSETLLVIDFVNPKIKSAQSLKVAHRNKMCVHVFIGMITHTCMSIVCTVLKKNQFFPPVVTAVGTRHCALTDTSRCMQLRPLKFLLLRRSLEHRYGGVFAVAVLLRELSYGFRYGGVPCRTFTNYDNRLYSIDVVDLKLNRRFFFWGGTIISW